ncbi:MAG TPA: hypothetical protein VMD74_05210 [Candidatus Methylomirabilis sp.]|nr:hypothetical protein [Candidatus Methylomirabilis sp.]
MSKKNIILIIVGVLVLLGLSTFITYRFFVINQPANQPVNTSNEIMFFFRSDCPHCLKAEQFLADNKVEEKIKITKKQVFPNKVTPESELLGEKAKQCGISLAEVGVPFVWDGPTGKCYMGDVDVINFFQQKLNQ